MKCQGYKVELVTEFAKELVYERQYETLNNQFAVSRTQAHRQHRLNGKVDVMITDSPLLLGLHYAGPSCTTELRDFIWNEWRRYDNENYFIGRVKPYQPYGRRQSEDSARHVDTQLLDMCGRHRVPLNHFDGNDSAPAFILSHLKMKGVL
jgi:hypothetical protein